MFQEAVFHQPQGAYGYTISTQRAKLTLRAKKGDLKAVSVVYEDRFDAPGSHGSLVLTLAGTDELFDYWQGTVESETKRVRYRFLLDDGVNRLWYAEGGFATVGERAGWFHLPYFNLADLFTVPDWVEDAVVYQIFPDRFCNGDETNDPEGVLPWGAIPTPGTFFGGDLAGILEKLPYLQDLGVNLLYLTPVFHSPSTHKYDTMDYFAIDPHFGDLETVKELVDEAHKRGMRVMLDAVFNHCGMQFPPFQDVLAKGRESEYADWFHIKSFPVDTQAINYETFATGVASMPKFRTEHPAVRQYLLRVAEYWVKDVGIDGWRLDVADEVDHAFWREFRSVVRRANPEALIVGEAWHESTEWLNGDQWDSVMNYLFRDACLDFFAKGDIDVERFDQRLTRVRMMYKEQATKAMFNLLDSHDTERFLTTCGEREELLRLAVTFQMCYVGIPEIYYGTEVGMVGLTDPDCRRCMIWDEQEQNRDLYQWFRRMISIRKEHRALQVGSFRSVIVDALANVYGYVRETDEEGVLVVLNRSRFAQPVSLPDGVSGGVDLLSGSRCDGVLEVEPFGAVLLKYK